MRLLITGTSLAGALREAWPAIAGDHADIDVDFFVAPHKVYMSRAMWQPILVEIARRSAGTQRLRTSSVSSA